MSHTASIDSSWALAFKSVVAAIALAFPATPCVAQIGWVERQTPTAPSPRRLAGLAYDSVRQRTVLFGGNPDGGPFGTDDTWEWDGASWTETSPATRPPGLERHLMAFDSRRGRTVLFGGLQVGRTAPEDTWEWDGTNWFRRSSAARPPAGTDRAMTFDLARGRVVLFVVYFGWVSYPAETWEWDGDNWHARTSVHTPTPRLSPGFAYDSTRGCCVLFGGMTVAGEALADTWEWDGTDWTLRAPPHSPSPRMALALAFDSDQEKIILFGGGRSSERYDDTWAWDGTDWSPIPSLTGPDPRTTGMVYDSARRRMVLFGGIGSTSRLFGDTWELTTSSSAASVRPNQGAEEGGEDVSIVGDGFPDASDLRVTFGGAEATVTAAGGDRVVVRTPPGSGVVDVAITSSLGALTLPAAFTYAPSEIIARLGNVNTGRGAREDVLLVNGNVGDLDRVLTGPIGGSLWVYMNAPSSREAARFSLYVWSVAPRAGTITTLPRALGRMVLPSPLAGVAPQPRFVFNNLGHRRQLGTPNIEPERAPTDVFRRTHAGRNPVDLTFQGLIEDDASPSGEGISVTNAVILRLR